MCQACRDGFEVEKEEHRKECGVLLHEKLDAIISFLNEILKELQY